MKVSYVVGAPVARLLAFGTAVLLLIPLSQAPILVSDIKSASYLPVVVLFVSLNNLQAPLIPGSGALKGQNEGMLC